ncbi:MAG: ABC transporter permease subunit [Christensenellaceae bacterium]|nr:ABC transporter permease subunit [Christensenellaceae bacterium]
MSIKNIGRIFAFDLKNKFKYICLWCVAAAAVMFLYMILFPSVSAMVGLKLNIVPKAMLKLFGMDENMMFNNFVQYFGMVYRIVIIALSMFASSFTAGLLYREESTKTIEFLNALPVSRSEIYFAKGLLGLFANLLLIFVAILFSALAGFINGGKTFVFESFIDMAVKMSFIPIFYWALAWGFAGITAKLNASSIVNTIMGIAYILGYIGVLLENKNFSYISPFELLSPQNVTNLNSSIIIGFLIYAAVGISCIFAGLAVYNKRDFEI